MNKIKSAIIELYTKHLIKGETDLAIKALIYLGFNKFDYFLFKNEYIPNHKLILLFDDSYSNKKTNFTTYPIIQDKYFFNILRMNDIAFRDFINYSNGLPLSWRAKENIYFPKFVFTAKDLDKFRIF